MPLDEEVVIQILWGFGLEQKKWDGLLSAGNAEITKVVPIRFNADLNEEFNEREVSWTSTTMPAEPNRQEQFQAILQRGGDDALDEAWDYIDRRQPRGLVVHLDAGPTATVNINTVAGRWTFSLGDLLKERMLVKPVGSDGSRFEAKLLRPCATSRFKTENVILVVLSGLRYTESFGDRDAQYMPRLCEELRQGGTAYENFYNDHLTSSFEAHCALVTGCWHDHLLGSDQARPDKPTIFECHKGLDRVERPLNRDPNRCVLLCGQGSTARIGHSSAEGPFCGEAFGATVYTPWDMARLRAPQRWHDEAERPADCATSDAATWNTMKQVMRDITPSMLMVSFGEMDEIAHTNHWSRYVRAVKKLDDICWMIWREIQVSPFYKDKTTLIITTDHGRHDIHHGGFADHGCYCEGCQRCIFLAVGPDIRPNHTVVTEQHKLIDIAPTIAELFGFDMPEARGSIMHEMLR